MAKVKVGALKGNLRLRWSHQRTRYCLTLGLADSPRNRTIAQMKADDIDRDIALGQFDSTLVKYKPEYEARQNIKVVDLFEKFIGAKSKEIYAQSLVKYHAYGLSSRRGDRTALEARCRGLFFGLDW
ncbi:Arm DNA-binding domain-containing protein [Leptolyngbya sp. AN03gr2]|uniref:Arm DNA-binding domain-containing protein n=1 Tax=unclassified Leptolyngbya TaxID=2650499 RepID=UPI003D3136BE